MIRTIPALLVAMILTLACSDPAPTADATATHSETATAAAAPEPAIETATTEEERPMSEYQNKIATVQTSMGSFTVRFFPDKAPNHVRNFIDLAESGFYEGIRFHRVVPGFVIQGGDPNTKGTNRSTWGTGGSGKNLKAEFNDIPHRRGVLSMARSGHPDSASSQFFVVVKDSNFLDNQYTVFGEVTEGMNVVDEIVAAAKGKENPDDPVTIQKVTVSEGTAS
ncbi:MAG TPA: peptidylprolyl isomerase [Thermoanaerobaculia bacterium]|nr:peptidylprolyl isomerase [Thermoanaerobaculia bacterium]